MTSAAFTINGTAVPRNNGNAIETTYGATVSLALSSTVGVNTVQWAIAGVSGASVASPAITRAGTPLGSTATFTVGADPGDGGGVAYGIRCTVTDGAGSVTTAHGVVGVPNAASTVPAVAGEDSAWRHPTMGWVPMFNQASANAAREEINLRLKGAACDGATDCATAFTALWADMASATATYVGGGIGVIPDGAALATTSVANKLSPELKGEGYGTAPSILWTGAAGTPVLQFTDCYGVALRDLWILGDQGANPTALVNLYRLAGHTVGTNGQFRFERCFFGMTKWLQNALGAGAGNYAGAGLLVDGTNGNNDEIHVQSCVFRQVGVGADLPNSQSIWTSFNDCLFDVCLTAGLRTAANVECRNLSFNYCAIDAQTVGTGRCIINGFQSENSSKFLHVGESSLVVIRGGTVAIGAQVGGEFVSSDPCVRYVATVVPHIQSLVLEDIIFRGSNGTDTINIKPAAGEDIGELTPSVILRNVRGLTFPAQLDVDPVDAFDRRHLVLDCENMASPGGWVTVDRILRWPETAAEAVAGTLPNPPPGGPAAAIADGADATVNAMLAVMRAEERIEWPADPDSTLLGDNEGWWNAADLGAGAGTTVASETDYSGNARHSVQATETNKPTARGVGAASYIEFDGNDNYTAAGAAADWQYLHGETWVFGAVVRMAVLASGAWFATWNGASGAGDRGTAIESNGVTGVIRVRTRSNSTTTSVSTPAAALVANTWHTVMVWRQRGVLTIEVDGVVQASQLGMPAPGAAADPNGALTTGCLVGGASFSAVDIAARATWAHAFTRHQLAAIRYHLEAVKAGL